MNATINRDQTHNRARFDIELESNIMDVESAVEVLMERPPSLVSLRKACQALRAAKLLLFNLARYHGDNLDATQRLSKLARQARQIAEDAGPAAPAALRAGFAEVLDSLECHVRDLKGE